MFPLKEELHNNTIVMTVSSLEQQRQYDSMCATMVTLLQYYRHHNCILNTTVSPLQKTFSTAALLSLQEYDHLDSLFITTEQAPQEYRHYNRLVTTTPSSLPQYRHYNSIVATIVSSLQKYRHLNNRVASKVSLL